MQELKNFKIEVNKIVMNNVVKNHECEFHRRVAEMQQRYLKELREAYPEVELVEVPLLSHEIKGLESIRGMEDLLFG